MHPPDSAEWERGVVAELLAAYRAGAFPMADPRTGRIEWFCPDPRAILPITPGGFHVPRRLAKTLRQAPFRITSDADFEGVIRACAAPSTTFPDRNETWIDERFIAAYGALHRAGHAHSIEAWRDEPGEPAGRRLVGGLYGVAIGGAFFAESKFCRPDLGGTDASKACLVHLAGHLQARGFDLLDVQFPNEHLVQFGLVCIRRGEFLARLAASAGRAVSWQPFEAVLPG